MSYQLKSQGASLVMIPSVAITHLNRTGFKTVFDYQKKIGAAASQYRAVTDRQLMDRLARFPRKLALPASAPGAPPPYAVCKGAMYDEARVEASCRTACRNCREPKLDRDERLPGV